ncbi:hypothetical protein AN214_03902 [Pseudoalteromonas sp. P1-9]|uniref:hypothetical protein n=1 Tax=Pseudoalteromonas sp. P1-9 TaxID=1710354 RepID=UPI0006D61D45|nr:hypothetical protein [Pseudoalteromonas sp. P1-9]KPV94069.1 hypothetical protein AN214_03902 [Pseudoalteromonas sp. P1-9]
MQPVKISWISIKANNVNVVEVSTPSDVNIANETLEQIFMRSHFKWLSINVCSDIGQSIFVNEKALQHSFIDENKKLEKIIEEQKRQIAGNDRCLSRLAPSIESIEKKEQDLTLNERALKRAVARLISQKRDIQKQIDQKHADLDFLQQRGFEITEIEKQKTESNYLNSLAEKHSEIIKQNEPLMAYLNDEIEELRSKKAELEDAVKSKQ